MLRDPQADPDQCASYFHLPELLEGRLAKQLNSIVTKRYANAVMAALTMPEGEGRQAVLKALSSAVGVHLSNADLREDKNRLTQRLAAEMPEAQVLETEGHKVQVFLRAIEGAFKKAWDADKARGMDMAKTSMAWFEHEMLTYFGATRAALRVMQTAGAPRTSEESKDSA